MPWRTAVQAGANGDVYLAGSTRSIDLLGEGSLCALHKVRAGWQIEGVAAGPGGSAAFEDQEMLPRQEVVLRREYVPCFRHLLLNLFRRKPEVRRRPIRRVLAEVDDGDAASGREL